MARNRDYKAEYARRMRVRTELIAQGAPPEQAARIARGHPRPAEPSLTVVTRTARSRPGESRGAALRRLNSTQAAQKAIHPSGGRLTRDANLVAYGGQLGGVVLNTNSQSEATRLLRAVAARGGDVVIIATQRSGKGIPMNHGRPIPAELLIEAMDDLESGLFDAIEDLDSQYLDGTGTVRISIDVIGGLR